MKPNLKKFLIIIATGFGVGYLPGAPGTYGTLVAFLIYLFLPHSPRDYFIFLIIAVILAIFLANVAEKYFQKDDPPQIVIDEMVGYWLALWALPPSWPFVFGAFILFRVFDIVKPYPFCSIERLKGGLGIILDDLMAGFYTWCILQAIRFLVR
jgi:phosphatidylglycerophosphatase A